MATVEISDIEEWFPSSHAVTRWSERVSDGDPVEEIEAFLNEASFRRRPPNWFHRYVLRRTDSNGPRRVHSAPILYAMSQAWPGVCMVVDRHNKSVITVVSKDGEPE